VLAVPVDKDGLITEALCSMQERVDWIHLSPSGQDPTGAILSPSRRNQLLTWCQANQTAIIEDAWDSEFHYGGDFPPPLFSSGNGVIFLYNFWRLLFPLSSIAVLVLPEDLIPVFRSAKNLSDRQFPTLEHYVLTELIESGKLEQHRRHLWKIFRKRRQALIFELKSGLRDDVEFLSPGSGMHVIVRFNAKWSSENIVHAGAEASLPLASTNSYYCENPVPNEFMVHFASVPPEQAKPMVDRFRASLQ
jgi:GntR family transcriptional regulator/MocR family aminotransferase